MTRVSSFDFKNDKRGSRAGFSSKSLRFIESYLIFVLNSAINWLIDFL